MVAHGHRRRPGPAPPTASLLRLSVGYRLAIATALSAALWLAVSLALG